MGASCGLASWWSQPFPSVATLPQGRISAPFLHQRTSTCLVERDSEVALSLYTVTVTKCDRIGLHIALILLNM